MTSQRAQRSTESQSPELQRSPQGPYGIPLESSLHAPTSDDSGAALSRSHSSSSHMTPAEDSDPTQARTGGCWTCRIRRKKCDEKRMDGSCATCLRLKIQCLGWGSHKPDWMKDKQQVELYKAQIKQQLIRSGRIRGQPKANISGPRPSSAPSLPTVPAVPSLTSTSPGTSLNEFLRADESSFEGYAGDSSSSSGPSASPMMALGTVPLTPDEISQHFSIPMPSASYPPHVTGTISYLTTTRPAPRDKLHSLQGMYTLNDTTTSYPVSHDLQPIKSSQERLTLYYFKIVLQQQYPISDGSVLNTLHEIVVNDPEGPVAYSICALAALYASKTASGGEFGIDQSISGNSIDFFNWSYWRLEERKQQNRQLTEFDAVAAIQLLYYCVLSGGSGNWHTFLKIAGDWLERSPISLQHNSQAIFNGSSDVVKFACRAVLWMDTFSSINFRSSPRFLRLHESLLRSGGSGFWRSALEPQRDIEGVRMDALMGCPDDVMLALAETADLESWKDQQRLNGSLSIQKLCDRARNIEALLRQGRSPPARHSPFQLGDASHHGSPINMPQIPSTSSPVSFEGSPAHYSATSRSDSIELHVLMADVFRNGALLYLNTVVNDHFPHVSEIRDCVQAVINGLKRMPITPTERALILPIFLAGCLAEDPLERTFFRNRLSVQDPHIGNISPALKLMETVWERRAVQGGGVDWRLVMNDLGVSILLL